MSTQAAKAADNVVPMPDRTLNLWQRLLAVQAEVDMLPKSGTAPAAMGGFKFVRDIDVFDAVRDLLNKHRVVWGATERTLPTTIEAGQTSTGKPIYRSTVHLTLSFRNPDQPDQVENMDWSGQGDDGNDKGLSKAGTSCVKYALLKRFLIGGDPALDPDGAHVEERAPAQRSEGQQGQQRSPWRKVPIPDRSCPECGDSLVAMYGGPTGTGSFIGHTDRNAPCKWKPDGEVRASLMSAAPDPQGHRVPTSPPSDDEFTDAQVRDNASARIQALNGFDREAARAVLHKHGWDGTKNVTEYIAGLTRGSALVLTSEANRAINASQQGIPM